MTKMSDTQLASFVDKAMKARLPVGFHGDITQRMILAADWNDKPEVVTSTKAEAAAKKRGTVVLYRTNNPKGRTSAKNYADMLRTGSTFSTGGNGGQQYGGGIYFSNDLNGSKAYGYSSHSNTIGAVLNKNAKVVAMSDLQGSMGSNWLHQHPVSAKKLGFTTNRYGVVQKKYGMGSYTALAMAMGYNVVSSRVGGGEKYYTVLNRGVLTTSTKDYWNSHTGMK
ncbi:MAG: hypothetical protein IJ631_03960 [Schwartzia sp.]|nr:hypothetical protein [Schwartzia sp. (in: firmicutes)]